MELLLLITVAVLVIVHFSSKSNQNKTNNNHIDQNTRLIIADKLEAFAERPEYQNEKETYLAIAESIRTGRMPQPVAGQDGEVSQVQTESTQAVSPAPVASQMQSEQGSRDFKLEEILHNVNLMLYLGAFLVVISAAILMSANFEAFSGVTKFFVISLFAAVFYGSGLYLFMQKPKLLPAGKTFVGIGLLLIPLSGLSLKIFLLPFMSWELIVFIVSLITLGIYVFTYRLTHQTYIYYLSLFMVISSIESGLISFGGFSYFGSWAALLIATVFMLRFKNVEEADERQALEVSANLLVPAALILQITEHMGGPVWPISISLLLAAGFYLLSTFINEKYADSYSFLSLLLLPLSFALFTYDIIGSFNAHAAGIIALLFAITSVTYLFVGSREIPQTWRLNLENISIIFAIFAPILALQAPTVILISGLIVLGGQLTYGILRRSVSNLTAALIIVTGLPILVLTQTFTFEGNELWLLLGLTYFMQALAAALALYIKNVREKELRSILHSWYFFVIALMVLFAYLYSGVALSLALFIATGFTWITSYMENNAQLTTVTAGLFYFALFFGFRDIFNLSADSALAFTSFATAPLYVMIGAVKPESEHSKNLRMSGLIAGSAGLLSSNQAYGNISLYIVSLITGIEAYIRRNVMTGFIAGGFLLAAVEWTFNQVGITELQFYTIPWAMYFGLLGYYWHRVGRRDQRDMFVVIGLSILSVPLLFQALDADTIYYFMLLVVESILLMLIGSLLRYRLLLWWGSGVLIVSTLYQVSDVILALPKYLLTLGAGVILLGVATFYLQRNNTPSDTQN